jgi:hypothetical protein
MRNDDFSGDDAPMPPPVHAPADSASLPAALSAFPASPATRALDSDLLALVIRAKATARELDAAEAAFAKASAKAESLAAPAAFVWRTRDAELFPKCDVVVGGRIALGVLGMFETFCGTLGGLLRAAGEPPPGAAQEALQRIAEIVAAGGAYRDELFAAREAAGFNAAMLAEDRLETDLRRVWREIALTPARTLLGVLGKLDAVSEALAAMPIEIDGSVDAFEAADVARMAAVDLAGLIGRAATSNGERGNE